MQDFLYYALAGFLAQLVDGALGMAFGLTASTVLLTGGVSAKVASATVHAAEVFTTAASALSHRALGNVDRALFLRLAVPGVVGAVTGAYILSNLPGDKTKPFVALYLLIMAGVILSRAVRAPRVEEPPPLTPGQVAPLGLVGAFMDAIGGGGWGPIVTSTLVARGGEPRRVIGTVNSAEFFVALSASVVFLLNLGLSHVNVIAGLVAGGVVAAPIGALLAQKVPRRPMMAAVGICLLITAGRTLLLALKG